jgi:hypothetical protein
MQKNYALNANNPFQHQILCSDSSRFIERANINTACERNPERLRAEYCYPISTSRTLPNFDKATKLALTAKLNSIGSSGGTTLVIISTQSNSNLLFFKSLSTPE